MAMSEILPSTFTPIAALAGGGLIGAGAVLLMLTHGRIAGIGGIAARLLPPYEDDGLPGRLAFVAGILLAPVLVLAVTGEAATVRIAAGPALLTLAGFLVGFGTVWGNGCTSGHGVCGMSRLSIRSIVATAVFMATGIATVFAMRHVF